MELALLTEAAGALSVGWGHRMPPPWWRRRVPSWSGLRSPGKKVNSESPCAPRTHPERRTEREKEGKGKKERHGETKLRWARPITLTLFSKGTFIPWLVHRGKWKMQSHSQPKHYNCFVFIKTRIFSAYLSHKQCCVQYLLALKACGHFMTLFW